MPMIVKPEEKRQLRAWAVETILAKAGAEIAAGKRSVAPTAQQLVSEARTLVRFILEDR